MIAVLEMTLSTVVSEVVSVDSVVQYLCLDVRFLNNSCLFP